MIANSGGPDPNKLRENCEEQLQRYARKLEKIVRLAGSSCCGPGLISGQFMWNLKWIKLHWR
jgi:hypothetical protein